MLARLLPIALLTIAFLTSPALAWNKPTHMVSGAIAYDVLKQDSPETIARVVELLKAHPQYDTFATRLEGTHPAAPHPEYVSPADARYSLGEMLNSRRKAVARYSALRKPERRAISARGSRVSRRS